MNIVNISISKIYADENQPRKYFDEARMGTLKASIKARGIRNPLVLEIQNDGRYMIVDGERRWRTAKALGLKEVPALLEPAQNEIQRLIEQFHVQEQHEGWTSVEKAIAVTKLSESLNSPIEEIGKLLAIPESQLRTYLSFGKIIDKNNFERSRISMRHAAKINGLRSTIKRIYATNQIDFDKDLGKKIENAIYTRVSNGEEINTNFFTRISDSVRQKPEILTEFIEDDSLTVDKMFQKSKARGALIIRRIRNNTNWLESDLDSFMKDPSVKIEKETIQALKRCLEKTQIFINRFE